MDEAPLSNPGDPLLRIMRLGSTTKFLARRMLIIHIMKYRNATRALAKLVLKYDSASYCFTGRSPAPVSACSDAPAWIFRQDIHIGFTLHSRGTCGLVHLLTSAQYLAQPPSIGRPVQQSCFKAYLWAARTKLCGQSLRCLPCQGPSTTLP